MSSTSAIRSAAVIDSWVIDSRNPSEATGHTSDSIRVMNATSVPRVSRPWPAASAPKPRTRIRATFGMISRKVQNRAEMRTFSIEVACRRSARSSNRANTWSARPNALMTRRPWAPSSTEVARSPVSSCTCRDSLVNRRSLRITSSTTGTEAPSTTRPSGQNMLSRMAVTTPICRTLTMMNSSPKPRNRRTVDRSLITRDRSCPDCHCPWKAIGSRCRCA